MEFFKKFRIIILVVLPLLIMVMIRATTPSHFKPDAKKWAEPSVTRTNIITHENAGSLSGDKLIVLLDADCDFDQKIGLTIKVPSDSVLRKENYRKIRRHKGPVLLCSSEQGEAARVWMILSQMGMKNVFILASDNNNEVLKYKFRPDTITGPEL